MEFDAGLCELRASALYLDEADIDRYLARAWEYRPEWLRVYPSAGTLLARHLMETGKRVHPVKGVLSSAENLYPYQKQLMEDAFEARVFSHYGHMELSALAGMCEHSDSYHVLPFYGHVELLDKDGRNIAAVGESGEITATSFIMNATLFVRYRTRDFAVLEGEKCPLCGRPYPCWSSVEGRLQEYAVTASGRLLAMTSINMYDDVFEPIKQFQFRQKEAGKLVFAYIPKESQCTREVVMRMRDSIADKFDNDMDVECLAVDDIPMTGRGKHRFLVQELEITHGDA